MTTKPIACELHDFLEIACMHHYRVKLTLIDNQVLEGHAKDIVTKEQHEYLVIENSQVEQIELTKLAKLNVLSKDALFNEVIFRN